MPTKTLSQEELDARDDRMMSMMFANIGEDIEGEVIDALEGSKPSLVDIFKNKKKIHSFLDSPDIKHVDESELLMHACRKGDLDIVKKTLGKIETNDFKMAFRGACYGNHQVVMNWLIKKASKLQELDLQRAELLEAPPSAIQEIKKRKYIDIEDGIYGAIAGGQDALFDRFFKMGARDTEGAVRSCWHEIKLPMVKKIYHSHPFTYGENDFRLMCEAENFEVLKYMLTINPTKTRKFAPAVLQYSTECDKIFKWTLREMKKNSIPVEMNVELLSAFKKQMPTSIDMFIENCTKESLGKYIDLKSIGDKENFVTGVKNRILRK